MVPAPTDSAHQGYHRDNFEGWYYRVTLPQLHQSLAFMYEVRPQFGASLQVLGIDDQHRWHSFSRWQNFSGNYLTSEIAHRDSQAFYSASVSHNQGQIADITAWDYQISAIVPWAKPVMGWLSYVPVCEPYWQILSMHGLAHGQITWQGHTYTFANAPAYSEKNWGTSFPDRWYWLQCNSWQGQDGLSLVSTGAQRQILGKYSTVAMVGLWWQGQWYRFMPDRSQIFCDIAPWGDWYITVVQGRYRLEIHGHTDRAPTPILVPIDRAMQYKCRDTGRGQLKINLWRGNRRLLCAQSSLAALETGGDFLQKGWRFLSAPI